jgi:hypothetical protein
MYQIRVDSNPANILIPGSFRKKEDADKVLAMLVRAGGTGEVVKPEMKKAFPDVKMLSRSRIEGIAHSHPVRCIADTLMAVLHGDVEHMLRYIPLAEAINKVTDSETSPVLLDNRFKMITARLTGMDFLRATLFLEAASKMINDPELIDFINDR